MAGRARSHSEERWALLPETIVRCNATRPNGSRCKREAENGAAVCNEHGAAAPQVRRRAAERLIMSADHAAQMLVRMMEDTEVPFGVRAKIAQDLLDRAGLIATQVHQIVPTTEDPIMRFFENIDQKNIEILGRDGNYYSQDQLLAMAFPDSAKAIESDQSDGKLTADAYQRLYGEDDLDDPEPETISEAEIVDDQLHAVNGDDRPPRVAEMIKAGAFDRKPGQ
jgi:hypothetical protein